MGCRHPNSTDVKEKLLSLYACRHRRARVQRKRVETCTGKERFQRDSVSEATRHRPDIATEMGPVQTVERAHICMHIKARLSLYNSASSHKTRARTSCPYTTDTTPCLPSLSLSLLCTRPLLYLSPVYIQLRRSALPVSP